MAPRKRTTRQRRNNPKSAKLEAFLQDFDVEVKTRVEQLKAKIDQLMRDVDSSYNMALIKLPMAVRQMPWLEYCKSEKPKSPEVDNKKREEEAAILESVTVKDHAGLLKSVKKISKKKAKSTSEDENAPSTIRKGKAAKKPPTKRGKALAVSKQNTSIRQSTRNPLVTPARGMLDSSLLMGPTPLITPRFDPRLPKTPAVRVPRHKETVYSISVNGSPIAACSDIVINVPIGTGESIQLLASQMDSLDMTLLDETAMRSMRLLQNRLTTLCGTSE